MDSLPLADCPHRKTIADTIGNNPSPVLTCILAAQISQLPLHQCTVSVAACRTCMGRPIAPEVPNDIVASMALTACNTHTPERMPALIQLMRPFLKTIEIKREDRITAAQLPCIYRGEQLRIIDCELCGEVGTKVETYPCGLPDAPDTEKECTVSRWSKVPTKLPSKMCLGCNSRVESAGLIQIEVAASRVDAEPTVEQPASQSPTASVPVVIIRQGEGIAERQRPYLSIVMACHDDFHGVYFTIQILRSFFREVLAETHTEIIVVDTNPTSRHGVDTANIFTHWCNGGWDAGLGKLQGDTVRGRYIPAGHLSGTSAPRDWAIREARGEVVLCLDCHVIPQPGSLSSLVDYFRANPESIDIVHGPLLQDNFKPLATAMRPVWGSDLMFGKWNYDTNLTAENGMIDAEKNDVFEIPMHGLGLFAFRKIAWPGLNPLFAGFGGEEGYIHDKFRERGGRVICLPALQWLHRFGRPDGVPYSLRLEDKFRNYMLGAVELGKDVTPILEKFAGKIPETTYGKIVAEVASLTRT